MTLPHSDTENQDPATGYENPPVANGAPKPIKRGRGRPRKTAAAVDAPAENAATGGGETAAPKPRKKKVNRDLCGLAASTVVKIQEGVCITMFGKSWEYDKATDEEKSLADAWTHYFVAHGIEDIPPGWLVFFMTARYAAPRIAAGLDSLTEELSDPAKAAANAKKGASLAGKLFKWARNRRAKKDAEKAAAEKDTAEVVEIASPPPPTPPPAKKQTGANVLDAVKPPQ